MIYGWRSDAHSLATKGYAAPAAGGTRARELAEQLDRSDYLAPLLYGQWLFHSASEQLRLALSLAERIEQIGEAQEDVGLLLLGHLVHGITRVDPGDFVAARPYLNNVIDWMIQLTALSM